MATNNPTTATAQAVDDTGAPVAITGARKIRVTSAATPRSYLQIAELQAVEAITGKNVALATEGGTAASSGSDYVGTGHDKAINGVFPGAYPEIYHSGKDDDAQFLEVTFAAPADLASVTIYGRSGMCFDRDCYKITILNDAGEALFSGQLDNRLLEGGGNSLTFAPPPPPPPPPPVSQGVTIEVNGKKYFVTTLSGTYAEHSAKLQTNPWWACDHNEAAVFARALGDKLDRPNWDGTPQNQTKHHPPYFVYWTGRFNIEEPRRVRFFIDPIDFAQTFPEEHNMLSRANNFTWAYGYLVP